MNNPISTMMQFQKFAQNFNEKFRGKSPQQVVNELIQSGQMSQQQFQQFSQQATQLMGGRKPF